ncbi:hypothetical protein B0H12DRAFT_1218693 [Mycena haematopus]|nr:hypothetical protein B0H12DRAFT_1218693 [Mycena haematopus]
MRIPHQRDRDGPFHSSLLPCANKEKNRILWLQGLQEDSNLHLLDGHHIINLDGRGNPMIHEGCQYHFAGRLRRMLSKSIQKKDTRYNIYAHRRVQTGSIPSIAIVSRQSRYHEGFWITQTHAELLKKKGDWSNTRPQEDSNLRFLDDNGLRPTLIYRQGDPMIREADFEAYKLLR